jgi:hypothetical protein
MNTDFSGDQIKLFESIYGSCLKEAEYPYTIDDIEHELAKCCIKYCKDELNGKEVFNFMEEKFPGIDEFLKKNPSYWGNNLDNAIDNLLRS